MNVCNRIERFANRVTSAFVFLENFRYFRVSISLDFRFVLEFAFSAVYISCAVALSKCARSVMRFRLIINSQLLRGYLRYGLKKLRRL